MDMKGILRMAVKSMMEVAMQGREATKANFVIAVLAVLSQRFVNVSPWSQIMCVGRRCQLC